MEVQVINAYKIVVSFAKSIPRSTTAISKSSVPDCYPIENVRRGYNLLGYVKRVKSPNMKKMLPRNAVVRSLKFDILDKAMSVKY